MYRVGSHTLAAFQYKHFRLARDFTRLREDSIGERQSRQAGIEDEVFARKIDVAGKQRTP